MDAEDDGRVGLVRESRMTGDIGADREKPGIDGGNGFGFLGSLGTWWGTSRAAGGIDSEGEGGGVDSDELAIDRPEEEVLLATCNPRRKRQDDATAASHSARKPVGVGDRVRPSRSMPLPDLFLQSATTGRIVFSKL